MSKSQSSLAKLAFRFFLTIGIVNLFADLTYEGARSIAGPFLGSLGASAATIGVVAGAAFALVGMGLWGIGNGAQSSLVKAALPEKSLHMLFSV